jgi:hypothetical protein
LAAWLPCRPQFRRKKSLDGDQSCEEALVDPDEKKEKTTGEMANDGGVMTGRWRWRSIDPSFDWAGH